MPLHRPDWSTESQADGAEGRKTDVEVGRKDSCIKFTAKLPSREGARNDLAVKAVIVSVTKGPSITNVLTPAYCFLLRFHQFVTAITNLNAGGPFTQRLRSMIIFPSVTEEESRM